MNKKKATHAEYTDEHLCVHNIPYNTCKECRLDIIKGPRTYKNTVLGLEKVIAELHKLGLTDLANELAQAILEMR